jgi:hypothetical protein
MKKLKTALVLCSILVITLANARVDYVNNTGESRYLTIEAVTSVATYKYRLTYKNTNYESETQTVTGFGIDITFDWGNEVIDYEANQIEDSFYPNTSYYVTHVGPGASYHQPDSTDIHIVDELISVAIKEGDETTEQTAGFPNTIGAYKKITKTWEYGITENYEEVTSSAVYEIFLIE